MNCSRFPIGTTDASRRQLGALTLRCGEKSSHQKTGLDVGIVKSAVADGGRFSGVCVQNVVTSTKFFRSRWTRRNLELYDLHP